MRRETLLAMLAALALAACETGKEPSIPRLDLPQNCGAEDMQELVGQPRSALDSAEIPSGTRVIGPDDAVTADYRPDRMNVEIGRDGTIEKVSCY